MSGYRVIHALGDGSAALVEWQLQTGRTHQIRSAALLAATNSHQPAVRKEKVHSAAWEEEHCAELQVGLTIAA